MFFFLHFASLIIIPSRLLYRIEIKLSKSIFQNSNFQILLYRALKRDVTRLGKRTNQGAFDDGVNSAMRYYINNYQDENRQRGIDILLGFTDTDGMKSTVRTQVLTSSLGYYTRLFSSFLIYVIFLNFLLF